MRIYLCSRTKSEYHAQNELVARHLEDRGLSVFVPHRLDLVEPLHKYNPFHRDYLEMQKATHCVAIGPFGTDCSSEIGWFSGKEKPILCFMQTESDIVQFQKDQPMVFGMIQRCFTFDEIETIADVLETLSRNEKTISQVEGLS